MPAGAGRSAGRVSVRVVPDSTGFRAELEGSLNRIERGVKIQIPASLDRLNFDRQLEGLLSSANGRSVRLNAQLDDRLARTEIDELTRTRTASVRVDVDRSALSRISAALDGLAKSAELRGLAKSLTGLTTMVSKIGATSLAVGGIGAAGLASVSGTLSLASSLTTVIGAGAALPGLLAGAALAGGTLAVALSTAKTELAGLTPALQSFQKAIGSSFFAQAKRPITDLVQTLTGQLRPAFEGLSSSLGSFTASFAEAVTNSIKIGVLGEVLSNVRTAIDNARAGIAPLVSAFSVLSGVGASLLPQLGQGFANLSKRFDDFLSTAAGDGSLDKWIATGITGLKSLASVVGSALSIVKGLFTAADNATGGNGLAVFAGVLKEIATVVNSSGLQSALTTIFSGAQSGAAGLAAAIKPIGGLLSSLSGTLGGVLATAGQTVGRVVGALASALSSPAVAAGLTGLFAGLSTGLNALLPALPGLASLLGTVGSVAGTLAATLGNVLGGALGLIVPLVQTVLSAVEPLIPVLGSGLVAVFQALQGPLQQIVSTLLAGIVPALVQLVPQIIAMTPMFGQILAALVPLAAPLAQLVVSLLQLATTIQTSIGPTFPIIIGALGALVSALQATLTGVKGFVDVVTALFSGNFSAIPGIIGNTFNAAGAIILAACGGILGRITSFVGQTISQFVSWGSSVLATITGAVGRWLSSVTSGIARIVSQIAGLPGRAVSALGNLGSRLYGAGADLVRGFINGMASVIGQVASKAAEMAHAALNAAKGALGIKSPSTVFRDQVGVMIPRGIESGIDRGQQSLNSTLAGMVQPSALARVRTLSPSLQPSAAVGGGVPSFTFGDVHNVSVSAIVDEVMVRIRREQYMNSSVNFG